MTVRSFDFLDVPFLPRYRRDVLPLDSARLVTRGNPLGAAALFAYLDPRRHIYTAVVSENGNALMGQIVLQEDETSARITFLSPKENIEVLSPPLLDHLVAQAGEWGSFHLLAEVDEDSPAFRSLRQAGFAMYASQRIWKPTITSAGNSNDAWRQMEESDWPAVQGLRNQIVPALLQPLENLPKQARGLVCTPDGSLQAYVAVSSGPLGIWLQPFVTPDSGCGPERLGGLIQMVSESNPRPVYVCVRSYQAWLETVLEEIGAQAGPPQAVMAKRLTKLQKVEERVPAVQSKAVSIQPTGMGQISEHKE